MIGGRIGALLAAAMVLTGKPVLAASAHFTRINFPTSAEREDVVKNMVRSAAYVSEDGMDSRVCIDPGETL